jgi:hypothetical protein
MRDGAKASGRIMIDKGKLGRRRRVDEMKGLSRQATKYTWCGEGE